MKDFSVSCMYRDKKEISHVYDILNVVTPQNPGRLELPKSAPQGMAFAITTLYLLMLPGDNQDIPAELKMVWINAAECVPLEGKEV